MSERMTVEKAELSDRGTSASTLQENLPSSVDETIHAAALVVRGEDSCPGILWGLRSRRHDGFEK
jgi:hypothetical protein